MANNGADSILNEVANTDTTKKRGFAGFKQTINYSDPATGTVVTASVRRAKVKVDSPFKLEGIRKVGPNGGDLRWGAPNAEWAVWEKNKVVKAAVEAFEFEGKTYGPYAVGAAVSELPAGALVAGRIQYDFAESSISQDQIRYIQESAEGEAEVSPFSATKTFDVKEGRALEECGFNENDDSTVLGTTIPRTRVYEFAPDPDKNNSTMEQVYGDPNLKNIAERLEADRTAAYFPLVKRKGITVHLACMFPIRVEGKQFMCLQTFGGPAHWDKPVDEAAESVTPGVRKPVLKKPAFRRISEAEAVVAAMPHQTSP